MSDRDTPPPSEPRVQFSGLVEVRLRCSSCDAPQVWALPEDVVFAHVRYGLVCYACRSPGMLFFDQKVV